MSRLKAAKRKRNSAQANFPNKTSKASTTIISTEPDDSTIIAEPKYLKTLISDEELEIAVDTLQSLAECPGVIKSKACKDLRVAVYNFRQACTTGVNTAADANLTSRISAALTDGKFTDALILLAEMRIRDEAPKLGALCRWVRDLDVISGLSMQVGGVSKTTIPRSAKDLELLRLLDAILRVTGPTDLQSPISLSPDPIAVQEVWNLRDAWSAPVRIRESVLDKTIFASCPQDIASKFNNIETTPGSARKPPNMHPATVYLTSDNAIPLDDNRPDTSYHKHPIVADLSLIKNVLSPEECKAIIAATESIAFVPDAPIRDDGSASSILAHNVYWLVDQKFHDKFWTRVAPHIPAQIAGKRARGINRRFRVYRYVPGAEYRCHIDGAWPPSGTHPVTGEYQYDSSPRDAKQSSLFTFLVYLNDEFEGGETTFFLPSVRDGVMNAFPVRPVMGAVAVFPHGEARGALLHEGTGVRSGAKYVIRTDVEYDVDSGRD